MVGAKLSCVDFGIPLFWLKFIGSISHSNLGVWKMLKDENKLFNPCLVATELAVANGLISWHASFVVSVWSSNIKIFLKLGVK